ncbi:ribonuclease Y [Acetobacterium wieringae]|uniref:Ribonuclease Y n=1 Tax=Acetobacterium wieringae TaxID=52694 RepID=A0ABY6HM74_9FIRM|nr:MULTISPECIES: ribonuclease Y [Acetobacterium]OXS26254.1 MAG: ribonuclease Y [Acetobacterium sp. MES1]URN86177.1 ribonuclease Y [Acetobacterium wieringae]UYO64678.1 ribonuclease Y [Acetobacterium wieringae]
MDILTIILFIGIIAAFGIGYLVRKNIAEGKIKNAELTATTIVNDAVKEGETLKKEILFDAKEESLKLKESLEKDNRERRAELQKLENRLIQKEENLEKKLTNLERSEESLARKSKELEKKQEKVESMYDEQVKELERISGLTYEEAKEILLEDISKDTRQEAAIMIRQIEAESKATADKKAKELIAQSIQRCAADHVAEQTITVVNLPNDEMKGRIIGREGRNIRTLETLTGIDLIIDDTPEAVILSGFDPIRREVARLSLEKLIIDGRIHPARIEEMVKKSQKEVDNHIKEVGEQACFDTGIHGLHPEIVRLLGRLKYRTSYGQNVLKHSIEVSHLAGIMAAELDGNIKIAKRAGLLHDIGKAIDHEVEGPHVEIGVNVLKKYKENKNVIHAVEAHHGDVEARTMEAVLVQSADAISAARPGARRETLVSYIQRLQELETIAMSFDGVEKSYAIQAGREVRIMVKPNEVNDDEMILLSRDIAKKIEAEMEYPGNIKVNLIRETRASDYAK